MKTTLTTSVLTAVALLVAINSSQGGNPLPPNALQTAATGETHGSPCLSAPKAQVFGNGRYVALGSDGKLRCSTDGIDWSPVHLPVESFLRGVAFGNGQFVAVGGSYAASTSVILTSVNGRSWNLATNPSKQVLHTVTYSGDCFIAVGANGTILTSKSARRWQAQNSGTAATLAAVATGNGIVVIGGDDGLMLSSRDTLVWTRQTSGTCRYVGKITFDHERFVATAGDLHLVSNDGSRWTAIDGTTAPIGGLLARTNVTGSKASLVE